MAKYRKQSDTTYHIPIYMRLTIDHVSPATGKAASIVVKLSKNLASSVTASGAITEVDSTNFPGLYKLAANATDLGTLGPLEVRATAPGCDEFADDYTIVAFDPFDSVRQGMTALPNANANAANGLYTRGTGAGQINQSANGQIDVNVAAMNTDTITAAAIQTDAIDAASLKADAVTKIQTGLATSASQATIISNQATIDTHVLAIDPLDSTETQTAVQAGLTAQGYTTARAGYLDVLNGIISGIWSYLITETPFSIVDSIGKTLLDRLASILAKANLISSGTSITVTSPVASNYNITVVRGDDYYNADGRAITFTLSNAPSISGGSVKLIVDVSGTATEYTGTVTSATECYFEFTTAQTLALPAGMGLDYDLQCTLSNTHIITPVQGKLTAKEDVR